MNGFYNRVLIIDLYTRTFEKETIPDLVYETCLGGKGLATRLLMEKNPAGVDPLSGDNHLIFATGPCCQGQVWGSSRYGVFTKSPLTRFYAESYAGGRVPEAIDAAGFDAVIIKGKARRPTVATVHPEGALFYDADDLWGMDTYQAEEEVKRRFAAPGKNYRRSGAVVIGPAGENLVRFALIENDRWRSAGRTGTGAVMGSKRLKAVLFQGDRRREVHEPERLAEYYRTFARVNKEHPGVLLYKKLGTTMMVALLNKARAFPTRYWAKGHLDQWEKISGETFHQEHDVKSHSCAKCFMACGRMARIRKGRHDGLVIEGPEYETIYAFGGLCLVDRIDEIAYLNDICDRLGMDSITAGNLCAFTIEACRRGRVDYKIDYGDVDGIAGLLKAVAGRAGIGDILAEGIAHAAKAWDLEGLAVHVKGMEPAGYDPRVLKGMGLSYAISDRGACHLRTTFYKPELAGLIPPDRIEGKAEMLLDYEDRLNLFDALILCRFYRDLYNWDELEKIVGMVTGLSLPRGRLRRIAASIRNMTRRFNLREGLKPVHDRLPKRLHRECLPDGQVLTEAELGTMLEDYYRLCGWDEKGIPLVDHQAVTPPSTGKATPLTKADSSDAR